MGKRVLITGCSSGIGRATALELGRRGYEVIATARRVEAIADLDVAQRLALDVDDDRSVSAVRGAIDPVEVLVNNAGFAVEGATETVPLSDAQRMFDTNFFGAARMIQAFVPAMRERGRGAIVNVSSIAGVAAAPLGGYYAASKFALEALSEALHFEVGHFGVRVIVIEPGRIETNFGANLIDHRAEPGPYEELGAIWEKAAERLRQDGDVPGPELVARTIADALDADTGPLRIPVGGDAEMVSDARHAMTFAEFESTMRAMLEVNW
jgi:NAD(P)-dependent dehydrogenase (short-subunit alcohol dehydrogenase family)